MRILTTATRLAGIGGLERAQLEACRQLSARGHRIQLLYTEGGDLEPGWDAVVESKVRVSGYALWRRAPLASAASLLRVRATMRRLAPDLVYLHHHRHAPVAATAGRPVVCHMHLPPPPRRSRQEALALRRVRGFIAVSEFTARQWTERLGRSADAFSVVPNGVDLEGFAPADDARRRTVRARLRLPEDAFLLVYAGRLDPEKGVDRALDALGLLGDESVHLAVAGEPNPGSFGGDGRAARAYGEHLRARSVGLPVTWLGRVQDVADLLAAADLVVLPSLFPDPFPLIVLETLASGTPIVASAVGGIPEVLSGRLEVSLVPAGDVTALAERVRSLLDWRRRTPQLGRDGRALVEQRFTLGRMGEQLDAAIRGLAGAPASRS